MNSRVSDDSGSGSPRSSKPTYVGRFAPSPTGPLHFGSAVAAIASFLDARANNGTWLIRIEDLDPPREQSGAATQIIEQLSALGMESDLPIVFQSDRHGLYQAALNELRRGAYVFPCGCTRREIGTAAYAGTCRSGIPVGKVARSERFKVPDGAISFTDLYFGQQTENLTRTIGDYNLVRADGLFSYHLAVVVDDAAQQITHVVRGEDLLASTARQIALQEALGYPRPTYRHFPVVCDALGVKLSKQTGAKQIDISAPEQIWLAALEFLQLPVREEVSSYSLTQIIDTATHQWRAACSAN